jgi:polysaccharide chain length determinant protein (PEP-CTERM system associated)
MTNGTHQGKVMQDELKTPGDYLAVLNRRRWSLILPFVIVFIIAAAVAVGLPPIYRSTSTILIEQQEIPPDFVRATVTSYAEERLQSIKQRIMSYSRLLDIMNRFHLYEELREKQTNEEIVERMREDIKLETISAEVVNPRTGRAATATIAFTLSYEGKSPQKVHKVANVLGSLYLEENLRVREQQALSTSRFLENEMKEVKADLNELEAQIAEFKEKHINELPELLQVNIQSLDRIERDIERLNDRLGTLQERKSYLQTQLASIPPEERIDADKTRLAELKVQLVHLKTRFSEEYPAIIKTRKEIAELEKELGKTGDVGTNNPGGLPAPADVPPDNPAYITLASQLAGTQAEIDTLKEQKETLYESRDEYRRRIEATPRVEENYKALVVERNNTQAKYDDLMGKFMEAKVAHGLEREEKGERFTLIDPARLPEKPVRPNRLAIVLIGFVLGVGAGVGSASLREFSDQSVRSAQGLARATSFPVLATIPEIMTRKEVQRRKRRRVALVVSALGIAVVAVFVFHFFVMDLDILWAKLSRRMG